MWIIKRALFRLPVISLAFIYICNKCNLKPIQCLRHLSYTEINPVGEYQLPPYGAGNSDRTAPPTYAEAIAQQPWSSQTRQSFPSTPPHAPFQPQPAFGHCVQPTSYPPPEQQVNAPTHFPPNVQSHGASVTVTGMPFHGTTNHTHRVNHFHNNSMVPSTRPAFGTYPYPENRPENVIIVDLYTGTAYEPHEVPHINPARYPINVSTVQFSRRVNFPWNAWMLIISLFIKLK